jgi:hypothetical protein
MRIGAVSATPKLRGICKSERGHQHHKLGGGLDSVEIPMISGIGAQP